MGRQREKRFLLFEGWEYDSQGGMREYVGAFEDLQSAIDYTARPNRAKKEWAHIALWIDGDLVLVLEQWAEGHIVKGQPDRWEYSIGPWRWE